jgi:DNA polymerase-3 subunit delta
MTPAEFLRDLNERGPRPVYLFLGSEPYRREACRRALIERALPPDGRDAGYTPRDLDGTSLIEVLDDARSLSLFAPRRVIWAGSAESVLPRGKQSEDPAAASALADYVARPTPGVSLVFEASRHEWQGEGKRRLERVAQHFGAVPEANRVLFAPYTPDEARRLARELAKEAGLKAGEAELELLAEATGYDAARIAVEIEKLRLFAGEAAVTPADVARLVPSARAATIFELVAALGRGDRRSALEILDTLVQEGEYLPLALSFLGTQFRQALVAVDMGLRSPKQIEDYFARSGARIWFKKASEIHQTATAFSPMQLKTALERIHQTDKALRDARPDDRTVLESFVLGVRAKGK